MSSAGLVSSIPMTSGSLKGSAYPSFGSANLVQAKQVTSIPAPAAQFSLPTLLAVPAATSISTKLTASGSFATPAKTIAAPAMAMNFIASASMPSVTATPASAVGMPQYLPNDHHEVENWYREFDASRTRQLEKLMHGGEVLEPVIEPVVDRDEPKKHEGVVDKMKDAVHNVEHKVEDVVHEVEHKVEDVVHEVHDKVSGFFGMIGGLFAKGKKGKGPAGGEHGKGSTVEVTKNDGTRARGHIVEHGEVEHLIQLHADQPGMVTPFPAANVVPVTTYAPVLGAGVEVLYDGVWYSGYVVALPLLGQEPPLYKVQCHGDEENQVTYADEASIRPLLSPEERKVVAGHMNEIKAQKEAEDEAAADQVAKASFKKKLDDAGLSAFYLSFTNHGYDTEEALEHMHDDELISFDMKPCHLARFYQAFPRGTEHVITNYHLKSTAPGIAYRSSKTMTGDSHKVAKFDTIVMGTEQIGGWLKVGNLYLPMEVDGVKVIFPKGQEPKEEPKSVAAKVEEKAAEAAHKVSAGLHSFAHMLHFE